MAARLVRTALAAAVLTGTFGLSACGATDADAGASAAETQLARNDHAHDLAAAQRATLVPVATRLELLEREKQRALLAGAAVTDVEQRIGVHRDLAASIESAPSAEVVRVLVDESGLELGPALDDSAVPTAVATD
ncbi:hypothetical protein [Modestobacter italicus]|uniref:hypothetical protein n=1 Tax=Modestobacter italicus (strain DSM 44449 / CECT 9708 / BC 501) TaxID=2732864 RepID=UPI001C96CD27|nr:hypothetical protein [Modestobacter italicus]